MVDYLLANCKNGSPNKWIASNANLINTLKLLFSLNFSMLIYSPFFSHRSIACLVFLCYLIRFGLLSLHRRKSEIAKLVWQNRRGIQYSCVRVWSFISLSGFLSVYLYRLRSCPINAKLAPVEDKLTVAIAEQEFPSFLKWKFLFVEEIIFSWNSLGILTILEITTKHSKYFWR